MDTEQISALLRAIRDKLDLSQEQLAEKLGTSFTTVNRWEGGKSKPQKAALEAIEDLARTCGVLEGESDGDLFDDTKPARGRRRGVAASSPVAKSPKPMEQMLRIYFMQNWFNLSDRQMEDALDVPFARQGKHEYCEYQYICWLPAFELHPFKQPSLLSHTSSAPRSRCAARG